MDLLKLLKFPDKTILCPKKKKKAFKERVGLILNVLELEPQLVKPQKPQWLCIISHLYKVMLIPMEVPDDSWLTKFYKGSDVYLKKVTICTQKERFYKL